MLQRSPPSVTESGASWRMATVCLCIIAISFGAPWIVTVSLKQIAAEFGGARAVPSFAVAAAWFGVAVGGILMGRVAEKVGIRRTVLFGTAMIAVGLLIANGGGAWRLYLGYGLFVGVLGVGSMNAPLVVYVTRWFDRRRGSALALISSGTYVAGAFWPPVFERAVAYGGWRQTMLWYAAVQIAVIAPLALVFLRPAPEAAPPAAPGAGAARNAQVLGLPPNLVFGLLCLAVFLCCVTMSMPQQHLVALCSDLGISPASGAMMVSVLLGIAFLSRQVWGLISDRIGGLTTVLLGSASQALAMSAFLVTQDELGLFAVSAAFGLGFSGLIPAYLLGVRELFPGSEAFWRMPTLMLASGSGMATGGWLAGVLYDYFGAYAPAFAIGILFNVANLVVIGFLVGRQTLIAARA